MSGDLDKVLLALYKVSRTYSTGGISERTISKALHEVAEEINEFRTREER